MDCQPPHFTYNDIYLFPHCLCTTDITIHCAGFSIALFTYNSSYQFPRFFCRHHITAQSTGLSTTPFLYNLSYLFPRFLRRQHIRHQYAHWQPVPFCIMLKTCSAVYYVHRIQPSYNSWSQASFKPTSTLPYILIPLLLLKTGHNIHMSKLA